MTYNLPKISLMIQLVILFIIIFSTYYRIHADEQVAASPSSYFFEEVNVDSSDFPVTVPTSYKSRRGYLVVKEQRTNGSKLTNRLPVIIVKARNKSTKPPVLKLAGGPGISGLRDAAYPNAYPWLSDRDYILLGQRGTQDAEPALLCPEYLIALKEQNDSKEPLVNAAAECRKRYDDAGIDLDAYHTSASAKDIEGLRTSLGIDMISIYAGSYGTRLALTYARDFPDRVTSMVLDSPLPHNAVFDDEYPDNLRDTLKKIVIACNEQPECSAAFPNVFDRFINTIEQVSDSPWTFKRTDGVEISLTDYELVSLMNIGSSDGIRRVPIIMDAIARKDTSLISSLLGQKATPTNFAWGMRLSYWCSESLPYSRRSLNLDSNTFANIDGAVIQPEVCEVWNVPKRPKAEKLKTVSSVPTLIIAGDFDALTPPKWGYKAAETLENSYVVNVPYGRHVETKNWSGGGCAMSIASEFFNHETAFLEKPIAFTECLEERQPPEFILSVD